MPKLLFEWLGIFLPFPPYLHQKPDFSPFQHNCIHCTISHQWCKFDSNLHPQKHQWCIKLGIPCNFKLSAQGRCNDIKLHPPPLQDSSHMPIEQVHEMNNFDSFSGFSDPGVRFAITIESVYYRHQSGLCQNNWYSCHGCIEQVDSQEIESTGPVPSWIHIFSKSTKSSSCRTQAASIAYLGEPTTKKVRHWGNRCAKRKYEKQNQLLTEVVVPAHVQNNLLTHHDVEKDILVFDVFDRGDSDNPTIKSTDSVNWQWISISEEKFIVAIHQNDPNCGLTYACLDYTHPFIRMPRVQSLSILGDRGGMISIQNALNTCKRLQKSPLLRSSAKRIF